MIAEHPFESFDVHKHLPFIVTRSTAKNGSLGVNLGGLNHRFKRRIVPKFDGVWGLDVIMSIDQNCWKFFINQTFSINNRMAGCRNYFYSSTAYIIERISHPLGCLIDRLFVGRIGADGWNF